MSSQIGKRISVTIFGESHGPAIGMVMDNPPAGLKIDNDYILTQNARRAPGNDPTATPRKRPIYPNFYRVLKTVLPPAHQLQQLSATPTQNRWIMMP